MTELKYVSISITLSSNRRFELPKRLITLENIQGIPILLQRYQRTKHFAHLSTIMISPKFYFFHIFVGPELGLHLLLAIGALICNYC